MNKINMNEAISDFVGFIEQIIKSPNDNSLNKRYQKVQSHCIQFPKVNGIASSITKYCKKSDENSVLLF